MHSFVQEITKKGSTFHAVPNVCVPNWMETNRENYKVQDLSNLKFQIWSLCGAHFFTVFRLVFNTIVNTCIYHLYQYSIHCKSKRRICNSRDWNSMIRYWTKCNKDQQNRFLGYWTPPLHTAVRFHLRQTPVNPFTQPGTRKIHPDWHVKMP